jgi:hypothetical protein
MKLIYNWLCIILRFDIKHVNMATNEVWLLLETCIKKKIECDIYICYIFMIESIHEYILYLLYIAYYCSCLEI